VVNVPRYAVYFAPAQTSTLWQLGCAWLGRDAATGAMLAPPELPGLSSERVLCLTASARHYGLHATLKPPFTLAERMSQDHLTAALTTLARAGRPFTLPALRISMLSDFIALQTETRSELLQQLAERCVAELDFLRRPAQAEELARRRTQGLSPRQEALLQRYGYPYVMDEWRFHMTLTARVFGAEREAALSGLESYLQPALQAPIRCEDVCLFVQRSPETAFVLEQRLPLGA
jgi:putative phosphonate metabolism protein